MSTQSEQPQVPFNRAYTVGTEHGYIQEAVDRGHLAGGGPFNRRCQDELARLTGTRSVLLTTSCTSALEMGAMLLDLGPGDEVIMPSFTFVTTATSVALRGAVPVFVDIREDTLNLDERLVEAAITERTKAIFPVHYAGVGCDMTALCEIADRHGLAIVEDAAQGLMSTRDGHALGTQGALGALSFHETKNITCGEGGALFVNDPALVERAEILREKGTNRSKFFRGQVDKYTWVDIGSSYVLSEMNAAYLWGQLEEAERITRMRLDVWDRYHEAFADAEAAGLVRRPIIPAGAQHNAHMYYVLLPTPERRTAFLADVRPRGIDAVFHYVPLHSSPAGQRMGRAATPELPLTDDLSARLVRLPLWAGLPAEKQEQVIEVVSAALAAAPAPAPLR